MPACLIEVKDFRSHQPLFSVPYCERFVSRAADTQGYCSLKAGAHGLVHLKGVVVVVIKESKRQQFADSRSDIIFRKDFLGILAPERKREADQFLRCAS